MYFEAGIVYGIELSEKEEELLHNSNALHLYDDMCAYSNRLIELQPTGDTEIIKTNVLLGYKIKTLILEDGQSVSPLTTKNISEDLNNNIIKDLKFFCQKINIEFREPKMYLFNYRY